MASAVNSEVALAHYLKNRYYFPKHVRPVATATDALSVKVGFYVTFATVNEADGMATIGGYLFKAWTDIHLTWDPSKFGGIKFLRLPMEHVWSPDITVNQSDSSHAGADDGFLGLVSHTGQVMHIPMSVYKLQADLVGPGHYQVKMGIGSWTYDTSRISLEVDNPKGVGMDEFVQGPTWNVASGGVNVTAKEYNFGPTYGDITESFPVATFTIDITKKAKAKA